MSALGLGLNRENTELICKDPTSEGLSSLPFQELASFTQRMPNPWAFLESVAACVREKIEHLQLMGDGLCHLHSHDAITMWRHSYAIPKMMHILHLAPSFSSSHLLAFDRLLKSILRSITNMDFQNNDPSWLQATLTENHGGIGNTSVVHLAPSVFLASADDHPTLFAIYSPSVLCNSVT